MKLIFTILIFLFGLNFTSFAQSKPIDSDEKLVNFYPSPATTLINFDIALNDNIPYTLQIFNFTGTKVYETRLTTTTAHLQVLLADFFRGIYVFQLRDNYGRVVESGKFQVIK